MIIIIRSLNSENKIFRNDSGGVAGETYQAFFFLLSVYALRSRTGFTQSQGADPALPNPIQFCIRKVEIADVKNFGRTKELRFCRIEIESRMGNANSSESDEEIQGPSQMEMIFNNHVVSNSKFSISFLCYFHIQIFL